MRLSCKTIQIKSYPDRYWYQSTIEEPWVHDWVVSVRYTLRDTRASYLDWYRLRDTRASYLDWYRLRDTRASYLDWYRPRDTRASYLDWYRLSLRVSTSFICTIHIKRTYWRHLLQNMFITFKRSLCVHRLNLKNMSGGLNLSRRSNMVGFT